MEKQNAVILADTRPALVGTVLLQLQRTNPGLFEEAIIYYQDDIEEHDRALMNAIIPCRFIKYSPPLPEHLFEKPRFKRFSALMFCRYEMFEYLNEFETVTWLDTDILVQSNLCDMINTAKNIGAAFIREDPVNKTAAKPDYMHTCFSRPVSEYKMDEYLYCSGTIVFSKKILAEQKIDGAKCTDWCYRKTVQWANILDLPDQGVLNAAIQEFKIKVSPLQGKKYCCYPEMGRDCDEAAIVHAWGSNKFWNDWYIYSNFPKWKIYYESWRDQGGTPLTFDIKPTVSVVIPSYKPDLSMLKRAMDSLMNQNRDGWERYSDFEIILIAEPFNQDELKELVESYKDNRIQLRFNNERLGIAASLNRGLKIAKGKYIARMDDDDVCHSARMFLQAKYLDEHPEVTLCTTDFEYFGDMNEWRYSFEGGMSFAWSLFTCPFDHPTVMFRKEFFVSNDLFYDEKRGFVEDWELWRRAFGNGMTVGCIHRVLFYHRWINNSSAGQSNKTIDMMRDMIQKNFSELGVSIPNEYLWMIGPWNGRLVNEEDICCLERYFQEALAKNEKKKIYDQNCLQKVFELRLEEATTGVLPGLSRKIERGTLSKANIEYQLPGTGTDKQRRQNFLVRVLKKLLKPLYHPFRWRYEDRLISIQDSVWNVGGHALNCIAKLDDIIARQEQQISSLTERLEELYEENAKIQCLLVRKEKAQKQWMDSFKDGFDKAMERLQEEIQAEVNRIEDRVVETIRSELKNICEEMSAKSYVEAENTRQELSGKICKEADDTRKAVENVCNSLELTREETHRHIDFTYRDIMVALERQKSYLPEMKIKLVTDYPVAYKSLDHLYPHGTIRDNTRYPRFIEKCEELLRSDKPLSFLDLGCSGGGMVLEAALREHISMGLEGSDCSQKEQRAEWRLLGNRLQTCDITKPFRLENIDGNLYLFDIITAWEVLEHIAEDDLTQLLSNIRNHLTTGGYFVASIANWADVDPVSGVNWHVTCHPYEWWKNKFENAGFQVCSELFAPIDLARGGYNPPHCYEAPYPDIDEAKTFHIVVQKNNHERG